MSNPKFGINEAVMVRCLKYPQYNSDFSVIKSIEHVEYSQSATSIFNTDCIAAEGFYYKLSGGSEFHHESVLRPIPKEKPNGICANQYIKDLIGKTVT